MPSSGWGTDCRSLPAMHPTIPHGTVRPGSNRFRCAHSCRIDLFLHRGHRGYRSGTTGTFERVWGRWRKVFNITRTNHEFVVSPR